MVCLCLQHIYCTRSMNHWSDNIHSLIQNLRVLWFSVLIIQQLHKALHVPINRNRGQKATFTLAYHSSSHVEGISQESVSPFLHQSDRGLAEQLVRQEVDLPHGVGQPHWQLLTQEHVRCFLTSIFPSWSKRMLWLLRPKHESSHQGVMKDIS